MHIKVIRGAVLNFLYNDIVTHIPVHFIRKGFLRIFNKKIHRSAVILMHSRMPHFWKIELGENVVVNQYCLLDCRRYKIVVSHNTDIGPFTRIWTLGHLPDSDTHELYGGDVTIGHHVWIASGVTILPSVSIGDGAVVAAASVVHKPVAALSVVGGNPARFLRLRHNNLNYKLSFNPFLE